MTELSPALRLAVHQLQVGKHLRLFDPDTNTVYVLVQAKMYDQMQAMLEEGKTDLAETYSAQSESALRAGWDAPEMTDYDNYDRR